MRELTFDVLVIGAGPGGLAAATAAAESGTRVGLVDENPHPGGQIWRAEHATGPGREARAWMARATASGVRLLAGTTVVDAASPASLSALDDEGPLSLRARSVVLALGATERFLPFPGWTLPGVVGVGGLQAMAKRGLEIAGRRVAVAGSGPLLLAVAAHLRERDADVVGVFEQAPRARTLGFGLSLVRHPRKLLQAVGLLASLRGIRRYHDAWPRRARGEGRLTGIEFSVRGRELAVDADFLACGFGLVPRTDLAVLLGCAVEAGRIRVDDRQRTSLDTVFGVGEVTGIGGVTCALAEGTVAGHAAAGREDRARAACRRRDRERRFARRLERAFALRKELRTMPTPDTIVCRCEDVRWSSLVGRDDVRDAKLKTRCGMGPCQGRVCGPALEFLGGWRRDRVRPPLVPVTMRVLAEIGGSPTEARR